MEDLKRLAERVAAEINAAAEPEKAAAIEALLAACDQETIDLIESELDIVI